MELVEGVGESSSPPRSSGGPTSSYDVKSDVYNRLIERGNEDAIHNPDFRDRLNAHFNRLPSSYVVDVNMDGVEDVVEHMKLLAMAKELDNRPAFQVQFLENIWTGADVNEDGFAVYNQRPSLGVDNGDHVPSHNRKGDLEHDFEPCSRLEHLNLDIRSNSGELESFLPCFLI